VELDLNRYGYRMKLSLQETLNTQQGSFGSVEYFNHQNNLNYVNQNSSKRNLKESFDAVVFVYDVTDFTSWEYVCLNYLHLETQTGGWQCPSNPVVNGTKGKSKKKDITKSIEWLLEPVAIWSHNEL